MDPPDLAFFPNEQRSGLPSPIPADEWEDTSPSGEQGRSSRLRDDDLRCDDYAHDSDDDVGFCGPYTGRHDRDWVADWVRSVSRVRASALRRGSDLPPLAPLGPYSSQGGKGVHFRPPSPGRSCTPSVASQDSPPARPRTDAPAVKVLRERDSLTYLGGFGTMFTPSHSARSVHGGSSVGGYRRSPGRPVRSMMSERSARTGLPSELSRATVPHQKPRGLAWPTASLILYAFSMPAAVTSAGTMVGSVGWAASALLCAVSCSSAAAGGWMLAEVARDARARLINCATFGDVGFVAFGGLGRAWGGLIQFAHLFLMLPVLLLIAADGLSGFIRPLSDAPNGTPGIYILAAALGCLALVQLRVVNASGVSMFTCVLTASIAGLQVLAAVAFPAPVVSVAQPAAVGNPLQGTVEGAVASLSGVSLAVWGYVPAFLAAELSTLVDSPRDLGRAFFLSSFLSGITMILVGWTVTSQWGWRAENPIVRSPHWPAGTVPAMTCSFLLVLANMATFCVNGGCLSRACTAQWQQAAFRLQDWTLGTSLRYLAVTAVICGLTGTLAWSVDDLSTLISLPACATVPAAAQIYPSACYAAHFLFPKGRPAPVDERPPPQPRRFRRSEVATENMPLLSAIPRVQSGSIHESDDGTQLEPHVHSGHGIYRPSGVSLVVSSAGPQRIGLRSLHDRRGALLPVLVMCVGLVSFGVSAAACAGMLLVKRLG
eukprot:TRINITY_DN6577_c0_g1_i1.p1 TRINITY_DN6577_c0_g1~~TRINITY_DN6577_c0_g1_i1.p1  ORF type:complete len:714 (+),score=156.95 TRINITY_DN6577_c0_g1_i1:58-2199(+)